MRLGDARAAEGRGLRAIHSLHCHFLLSQNPGSNSWSQKSFLEPPMGVFPLCRLTQCVQEKKKKKSEIQRCRQESQGSRLPKDQRGWKEPTAPPVLGGPSRCKRRKPD